MCAGAPLSAPPRGEALARSGSRELEQGVRPDLGVRLAQQAGERCSISDSGPPSATAITGSPLAWASRITWPKVSVELGNRNTSAFA